MQQVLQGGISINENIPLTGQVKKNGLPIWNSLKNGIKTALFMEALRNLNWSRDYLWYVELDGVPNPFQRGGVLGLPCKSINFTLAQGKTYEWTSGVASLSVPQAVQGISEITLELLDDEQGTLRQFFERWFNQVYNPYSGVLPVTEACKQISIYYQKSTRRNVKRVYYDIDKKLAKTVYKSAIANTIADLAAKVKGDYKVSDSTDFLVFPANTLQLSLSNNNDLISFSVTLQVAHFINQDFGNPNINNGVSTIFDTIVGDVSNGNSWLDRIGDYI